MKLTVIVDLKSAPKVFRDLCTQHGTTHAIRWFDGTGKDKHKVKIDMIPLSDEQLKALTEE